MASLVSSGITPGERRFAPGSASNASERATKVTAIGWAGSESPPTSRPRTARERHDPSDLTTRQEYLKAAQTLLRTAKTMTDQAIAGELKALADDYERRAQQASRDDAAKALARSALSAERE
jgi:hypothetical protein